ncbi:MAG: ABC transporter ATP-binding protein, partial [Chloroflexaceae bacterium]|nr:ABC transporter ATP-binding protein [Chloroflexaceae bacterium]
MMRPGLQSVAELPEEQANQRSKVARRLLGYLRPYTGLLSVVLVMTILAAAAQAAGPFLIGLAIDSAIGQG